MPKLRILRATICAKVAENFRRAPKTVKLQFKKVYDKSAGREEPDK